MLKNQWADTAFSISSLNDRTPTQPGDDIIVLASPDPQGMRFEKNEWAGHVGLGEVSDRLRSILLWRVMLQR